MLLCKLFLYQEKSRVSESPLGMSKHRTLFHFLWQMQNEQFLIIKRTRKNGSSILNNYTKLLTHVNRSTTLIWLVQTHGPTFSENSQARTMALGMYTSAFTRDLRFHQIHILTVVLFEQCMREDELSGGKVTNQP